MSMQLPPGGSPLQSTSPPIGIQQQAVQQRLLALASQQLSILEQGQINPALTQDMANIAIAAGLGNSKSLIA